MVSRLQHDILEAATERAGLAASLKATQEVAAEAAGRAEQLACRLDEANEAAEHNRKVWTVLDLRLI